MNNQMAVKVAIIGAGPAGLAATKRVTESSRNFTCCTFEQTDNVGGIWVYSDKSGKDEYGLPIHSSMYKNLRTNFPKEIMRLPELGYERIKNRSYLRREEVLQYFEDYADHFELRKHVKLRHHVKNVAPTAEGKWKIEVIDLKSQNRNIEYFDAVMICVGKFSNPSFPKIPNIENFSGLQMHSHDYREASLFKNKTVLTIGGRASAIDISFQICSAAKKVYMSHHNEKARNIPFPNNLEQKPDVREIQNGYVVFTDGSKLLPDVILYCTGYTFKYPFLDPECKIVVKNMVIKPLYKHLINIEHPTMCIVGIPRNCPGLELFDLQISVFLNILEKKATLPSKAKMYAELEQDIIERRKITGKEEAYHMLDQYTVGYCAELAEFGKTPPIKPVVFDVCFTALKKSQSDFLNYRNLIYEIIDDRKFITRVPSE